jgi:hypothetical protein
MQTDKAYLEDLVNSDVRMLIFNGNADYILNFNGGEAMVRPVHFSRIHASQVPDVFLH